MLCAIEVDTIAFARIMTPYLEDLGADISNPNGYQRWLAKAKLIFYK